MKRTEKTAAKKLVNELIYWAARFAEDISEEDYKKLTAAAEVLRQEAKRLQEDADKRRGFAESNKTVSHSGIKIDMSEMLDKLSP